MKKIFCDCCAKEMTYDNMGAVSGQKVGNLMDRHGGGYVNAPITITFDARAANGEHIDICRNCRWDALDKLDPRGRDDVR